MDAVRPVREERRHEGVDVRHRLGEDVQHRPEPLALVLALELERLGPRDVGVGLADDPHRLADPGLEPLTLDVPADGGEAPRTVSSSVLSTSSRGPAGGISPKLLWIIEAVRLTRLPHPATSSELLRWTNSAQVKFASWFSGPAAQMK